MVEIAANDLAAHGDQAILTLRERNPAGYCRLASDLATLKVALRSHTTPDAPVPPPREPTTHERLAERLLEAVAVDFTIYGAETIARLREGHPSAYVRLVSEVVQFEMLTPERAPRKNPGKRRREPRQVRVNNLLRAAYDGPIDVNNPILPGRWLNRWLAEEEALKDEGLTAFDLTAEELRARWPKRLAEWFEKQLRSKVHARSSGGREDSRGD